jgi:hypothetical protein
MKALIVSSKSMGHFDSKVEIRADGARILKSRTTSITAAGVAN